MTRRVLAVVGLVVAVALFATGLLRWLSADGDVDDARAARDEQAATTEALQREVDELEAVAAGAREPASTAVDTVGRILERSDAHVQAARRLLAGREEEVRRLRAQDFARYSRFIHDLERQEDAVHRTQVRLFQALDPLNAALLALEERLAEVAG